MPRHLVLTVALLVLTGSLAAQSDRSTPDALARSLQQRYQSIRDFSADFVHSYRGGVLRTQTTERGQVAVKKPGMMRWIYTAPERKEFVSDGVRVYTYLPQDRQVIVSAVPATDQATTPALFLAGRGDIARDFAASFPDQTAQGTVALKLTPRRPEPDYEYLIVTMDPATLQIRSLSTRDRQGGDSTLTFTNMKENQGLPDKDFVFRIPRGVTVVTDGTSR